MISEEPRIVDVFLDQLVLDITELIIWFVPMQYSTIKDVFPTVRSATLLTLVTYHPSNIPRIHRLSLFRLYPPDLLIRPSLMRRLVDNLFFVLFPRFWRVEIRCPIEPNDRDVKVGPLVSTPLAHPMGKVDGPVGGGILTGIVAEPGITFPKRSCSKHVRAGRYIRFGAIHQLHHARLG